METTRHRFQMNLLIETLKPNLAARSILAYVAGNNFLYYRKGKPPKFCGPDFYVVLGREETDQPSYVVWEENNQFPNVIIELTSETTEQEDRGSRYIRYRDVFKTGEYFMYHPITRAFEGYSLLNGVYVPKPFSRGQLSCDQLGLSLAVRSGWLRWIDGDGAVLPSGDERAESEFERAEAERERAEEERKRAESAEEEVARLRAELRRLTVLDESQNP